MLGPAKADKFQNPFRDSPQLAELAAEMIQNGKFDSLRAAARSEGDAPWRVLRYCRVIDPEKASYPLPNYGYTRPETFSAHIRHLKKHATIVPLEELVDSLLQGASIKNDTVAITLDGGWIDTFVYAAPILAAEQVPATVFLPTAYIGTNQYLWEDKLLLGMSVLMKAGVRFEPFPFLPERFRDELKLLSPDGLITLPLIFMLTAGLMTAERHDREQAVSKLGELVMQLGFGGPVEPAFMSWDEVSLAGRRSGLTFGTMGHTYQHFHTVSHEVACADLQLANLSLADHFEEPTGLVAAPYGVAAPSLVTAMQALGLPILMVLERGDIYGPEELDSLTVVPRVPLYEGNSFTPELFHCRLWSIL